MSARFLAELAAWHGRIAAGERDPDLARFHRRAAAALLLVPPVRVTPDWLTYDEAIGQLKRGPDEDRAGVEAALADAGGVIFDYLKLTAESDPGWTPATVPHPVKAATKLMLTHLYEHRGDDQRLDDDLWTAIDRLLIRSRDPALA